jgi:hypothetical protein
MFPLPQLWLTVSDSNPAIRPVLNTKRRHTTAGTESGNVLKLPKQTISSSRPTLAA